jgi:hypothetical protein
VEKQLPCVYVAFLIVTLLLIAGPKTEAQVKQTVSIKALTLGVVYQSEPQPVAEHFRPLAARGEMVLARVKSGTQHATHTDETRPRILTRA